MMVMMVVVMVPVAPVVMVVVMMVVMHLRELHPGLCRGRRRTLVNHFQCCRCIRDRLQQVGVGIGLQDVRRLAGWARRGG